MSLALVSGAAVAAGLAAAARVDALAVFAAAARAGPVVVFAADLRADAAPFLASCLGMEDSFQRSAASRDAAFSRTDCTVYHIGNGAGRAAAARALPVGKG